MWIWVKAQKRGRKYEKVLGTEVVLFYLSFILSKKVCFDCSLLAKMNWHKGECSP